MEHRCELYYKFRKFKINIKFYDFVRYCVNIVALIINIFIFFTFKKRLVNGVAVEHIKYN